MDKLGSIGDCMEFAIGTQRASVKFADGAILVARERSKLEYQIYNLQTGLADTYVVAYDIFCNKIANWVSKCAPVSPDNQKYSIGSLGAHPILIQRRAPFHDYPFCKVFVGEEMFDIRPMMDQVLRQANIPATAKILTGVSQNYPPLLHGPFLFADGGKAMQKLETGAEYKKKFSALFPEAEMQDTIASGSYGFCVCGVGYLPMQPVTAARIYGKLLEKIVEMEMAAIELVGETAVQEMIDNAVKDGGRELEKVRLCFSGLAGAAEIL